MLNIIRNLIDNLEDVNKTIETLRYKLMEKEAEKSSLERAIKILKGEKENG